MEWMEEGSKRADRGLEWIMELELACRTGNLPLTPRRGAGHMEAEHETLRDSTVCEEIDAINDA
jgi:hypothetical protein